MPPVTVQQAFELALQHHQAGRLAEAEALYRQILAVQPNHADALHLLGVVAHQVGRHDLAADWIRGAIALNGNNPHYHCNLGNALREQGNFDAAIAACRRAIELKADFAEAYNNLGNAQKGCGQFEEAIAAYQCALRIKADFPEAHNNLGLALNGRGSLEAAVSAFGRALQLNPRFMEAYNNLGNALKDQGRLDDAIAAYRRALEIQPASAQAHRSLGDALKDNGKSDEAFAAYRAALALNPDDPEVHNNLGILLASQGRLDEAVTAYHHALKLKPEFAEVYNNLGIVLASQGRLDEAVTAYRQALKIKPDQPLVHGGIIFALHRHPGVDYRTISEEHCRWNRQFSEPLKAFILPHANDRSPERRLRVGYVSADFGEHVVGRNLMPLFRCHEHRNFELVCYSGVVRPDSFTEAFRQRSDLWRRTVGVDDEALAAMIREDGVDILVDLAQQTQGNRLPVFARKPAPVQVSFAGYPATTGLEAIEYRISDRWLEGGMGDAESGSEKEQVFLIDSFWCYDPCGIEAEVNGLPVKETRCVTFGSLNNFCKINEPVLKLWAQVLGKVKDSRLILLTHPGSHRQRTLEYLDQHGVSAERVEFAEPCARQTYLELYHRVDIVLDPFPYGGHTTSLDALWMGVPVVSLAGRTTVSRAGLSILTNLGLPELVALQEIDYLGIAVQLANDLPRLTELRATLRQRMEASVLMDAPRFARQIEDAYRTMWRQWCAEQQT